MNTRVHTPQADLLIGAIDHHDWSDVCCWHRSALRNGFTGRVVLFCYEHMSEHAIRRIEAHGITIIHAKSIRGVNEDRFKDVARFAASLPAATRVLMTDVRDVAFQRSIHHILDEMLAEEPLACASEGLRYQDSPWNLENARTNFPELLDEIAPLEIYCAGVIAGRAGAFAEFCEAIWRLSTSARSFNGDQAAMNLVLRTAEYAGSVALLPACNAQVCHHGNLAADPRLTTSPHGLLTSEQTLVGVFHQYTRNTRLRMRTLLNHGCLLAFLGGKLMTALRKKLHLEPQWAPYWAAQNA